MISGSCSKACNVRNGTGIELQECGENRTPHEHEAVMEISNNPSNRYECMYEGLCIYMCVLQTVIEHNYILCSLQQSGSDRLVNCPLSSIVIVRVLGCSTTLWSSPRTTTVNASFGLSSHSWSLTMVMRTHCRCCWPGANMSSSLIVRKSIPPADERTLTSHS